MVILVVSFALVRFALVRQVVSSLRVSKLRFSTLRVGLMDLQEKCGQKVKLYAACCWLVIICSC